jgi:hypothetical protein
MGKKDKQPATSATVNVEEIVTAERNRIKDVLSTFSQDRQFMIEHHLDKVKENTGEIRPEDVTYVVNLFMRELNHII